MSEGCARQVVTNQQGHPPRANEVTAQMERILEAPSFAQSARLQKFLRYIVDETLAGRGAALKEYTLALEVFERPESFDPQTNSLVRVEASRLRAKLDQYAAGEGRNDPLRITLPAGGYIPEFVDESERPAADSRQHMQVRRLSQGLFVLATLLVFLAAFTAAFLLTDIIPFDRSDQAALDAQPSGRDNAVAVLPLRDLSTERVDDAFSVGMTDALTTRLARTKTMPVTSMTSAMRFQNTERPLADVAKELGVTHLVEGSVLKIGDRVRITAKLIHVASERHLWADSYERDFTDILKMQDDLANQIVASLSDNRSERDGLDTGLSQGIDPDAYEAHLRGRFFLSKMTEDGFRKGIESFREAIENAPEFAAAHSGLASCFCLLGGHGFEVVNPNEGMPAAKEAALEALRLDETLAEPHAYVGIIRLKYEWDWTGAEEAFQRSIELNPSFARARIFYSFYLEAMGRQDEAIREAEAARALDPISLGANINLGWQYLQAGRPERARKIFERTKELDRDFWGVHWGLGHYHRRNGDYLDAIAAFQKAIASGGGHAMPLSALGYTYAITGGHVAARQMLDKLATLSRTSYVSPVNMAIIHTGLGNTDEAFDQLEQAYADRSRALAWLNVTPELDDLRSDPRFDALHRGIGLPEPKS